MSQYIEFSHGALSDSYEEQANEQGFTYGGNAELVEKIGSGLLEAYYHGCITDSEYDRILQRFQKKILASKKFVKRLAVSEDE